MIREDEEIWTYPADPATASVGLLAGIKVGDRLECGIRAPFSGPDIFGDPPAGAVLAFLDGAVSTLHEFGLREVVIRARPASYGPAEEVVQYGLLNRGFAITTCDLSYSIALQGLDSPDDYLAVLPTASRTKLRRVASIDHRFTDVDANDDESWRQAYRILDGNRRAKGRRMSITLEYVRSLRTLFPDRIHMTLLYVGGSACAAALLYRVMPDVMLLVSWGDFGHDLPRSPMNLLAAYLVPWCAGRGARLLDLGRATEDGPPNLGLMQFKRSIMGKPEMRPDYRWRVP